MIRRFMQHLRCACCWYTLYGHKGVQRVGKLYPNMHRIGPELFGILPLNVVPNMKPMGVKNIGSTGWGTT